MAALKLDLPGATERLKAFAGAWNAGDVVDQVSGLMADDLIVILIALGQRGWDPEADEVEEGRRREEYIDGGNQGG